MIRFTLIALFSLIIFNPLKANPLSELDLDPTLFQFQKLRFDPGLDLPILQEHLYKDLQNSPENYGLLLAHLLDYSEAVEEKSKSESIIETKTLEHQVFHHRLERITPQDQEVIKGYFILKNFDKHLKEETRINAFIKSALAMESNPWQKFLAALIIDKAHESKANFELPNQVELIHILQKASSQPQAKAFFHYTLGSYYLREMKDSNQQDLRLRLVVAEFEKARTKDRRNRNLFTRVTSHYIALHEELDQRGIPQPFEFEELVYRRIILLDPRNPWAHNNLAYLYCENDVELREALREVRIANHLDKNNPYLMDTLGWALYKNKLYEQAESVLKKAIELDDTIPDLHFHLATTYYDLKKYELSVEHFKRTIELDPESSLAMNNLAYLYSELDRNLDEGLELVTRALEKHPNVSAYIDTLGWLHFKKGNYDEAINYLKRAVELDPDSSESQYHLSQAYLKANQGEQAVDHMQKSMNLVPKDQKNLQAHHKEELNFQILLQSIHQAKQRYLAMPDSKKDPQSLKVFYDQLIFVAQSKGDTTLIQRYAQEFEAFKRRFHSSPAPQKQVAPQKKDQSLFTTQELPTESQDIASVREVSIREFFPKNPDFYIEVSQDSVAYVLQSFLQSEALKVLFPYSQIQRPHLIPAMKSRLPKQVAFFIGRTKQNVRLQIYGVIHMEELQAAGLLENLELMSQGSFQLPVSSQKFELVPFHGGIYHLKGKDMNFFLTVKSSHLIVSNSLAAINNLPFAQADSLTQNSLANTALEETEGQPDGLLVCTNPGILQELFDGKLPAKYQGKLDQLEESISRVDQYVSLVQLKDEDLQEFEFVSVKQKEDLEKLKIELQGKAEELKKAVVEEHGTTIDTVVEIKNDKIYVQTRFNTVQKLIKQFMDQLKDFKALEPGSFEDHPHDHEEHQHRH